LEKKRFGQEAGSADRERKLWRCRRAFHGNHQHLFPIGSDARRKLEAYAALLRSSGFASTSLNRTHF